MIATSGVEKVVKLWSALPLPQARNGSRESGRDRQVYSHDEYIRLVMRSDSLVSHDYSSQSVEENPQMMAFFDSLVQREIEGFEGSSSSSSSDEGADVEEEYSQTVVEPEEDEEDENMGIDENVESESGESQRRERVLQRISLNVADGLLSSDVGAGHRVRVVEEVSFNCCFKVGLLCSDNLRPPSLPYICSFLANNMNLCVSGWGSRQLFFKSPTNSDPSRKLAKQNCGLDCPKARHDC